MEALLDRLMYNIGEIRDFIPENIVFFLILIRKRRINQGSVKVRIKTSSLIGGYRAFERDRKVIFEDVCPESVKMISYSWAFLGH